MTRAQSKNFGSELMSKIIVDKARLLRRAIIISWASLALCFIIKIFGGNFFEIMCESPNYKALCDYADTHFWLKFSITFLSSMYCQSLYLLTIAQQYKFKKWQFVVTLISVLLSCFFKLTYAEIGVVFDILLLFVLPCLFLGKQYKKYWHIVIAFLLTLAFQLVSLATKNLAINVIDDSTFISLIYGVDVYIMCLLYYLYRNYKKESTTMGAFWVLFMGKPEEKLLAMKARSEKRIDKEHKKINAIDLELARRNKSK